MQKELIRSMLFRKRSSLRVCRVGSFKFADFSKAINNEASPLPHSNLSDSIFIGEEHRESVLNVGSVVADTDGVSAVLQ